MVEQLREFKIKFYSDSNKATNEREFSLENYASTEDMLADVKALIKSIEEEGVLEAF
jgi:hypothetical protein